jgi:hypothetical protein
MLQLLSRFSLHDELQSLSKSGMTTHKHFYSATVAPSNWMKKIREKIKIGYNSDLVLLQKTINEYENTKQLNMFSLQNI